MHRDSSAIWLLLRLRRRRLERVYRHSGTRVRSLQDRSTSGAWGRVHQPGPPQAAPARPGLVQTPPHHLQALWLSARHLTSLSLRETPSHGASKHKLGAHYLVFLLVTTTTGELIITTNPILSFREGSESRCIPSRRGGWGPGTADL